VVASLARDLATEFPATQGFSAANLWRMKLFYETYGSDEKLAPLVRENRVVAQCRHIGEM
jgi:hypothetical protein